MKSSERARFRVYEEQVKTAHTSHWDWDYMSQEELDRLHSRRAPPPTVNASAALPPTAFAKAAVLVFGVLSLGTVTLFL